MAFGMAGDGFHHRHPEADVGHKHPIHDVQMKPMCIAGVHQFNVTLKVGEIGGQQGWGKQWDMCKCPEAPLNFSGCGQDVKRCTFAPWPETHINRPFVVGITGGIAAGKSTVCRMLSPWGWPCGTRSCCQVAVPNGPRPSRIGDQALRTWVGLQNGEGDIVDVDRAALARTCLDTPRNSRGWNPSAPAVARAFDTWLDSQRACTWVVREAAILFESNSDQGCDAVVTVEAPMALRKRVPRSWRLERMSPSA